MIKLVNYGVITPLQELPEVRQWQFDVAAELLDEVQDMRREVNRLNQRIRQLMGE